MAVTARHAFGAKSSISALIAISLALCLFQGGAWAAPQVLDTKVFAAQTGPTCTLTYTVPAGTNKCLVLSIGRRTSTQTPTNRITPVAPTTTVSGTARTFVQAEEHNVRWGQGSGNHWYRIGAAQYYLLLADYAGAALTISCGYTAGTDECNVAIMCVGNIDQAAPTVAGSIDSNADDFAGSTTLTSNAFSANVDNIVIDSASHGVWPTLSVLCGTGQDAATNLLGGVAGGWRTALVGGTTGAMGLLSSYKIASVTGSQAMTYTAVQSGRWVMGAMAYKSKYRITVTAGAGGTITPGASADFNYGASQTYTIAPNSGYAIQNVVVDGVSAGAVTSYAFSAINAKHSLWATFVPGAATITAQPQPVTVTYPATATFSVTATGSGLTYQWRNNAGQAIAGATTNSLTLHFGGGGATNADAAAGPYYCDVTSGATNVSSNKAALTVNDDPKLVSSPGPTTVAYGATASFTVSATGSNFGYQWYKNGVGALSNSAKYSGATTATLQVLSSTNADEGWFYCEIIDNSYPSRMATSASARLSVTDDPRIATDPASTSAAYGATASFTVVAEGSNYSLQWYKAGVGVLSNGAKYTGVTTTTLSVINCVNADEGDFYCIATDNALPRTAQSANATLTVTGDPAVVTQPSDTSAPLGGSAGFTIVANGSGFSYRWYKVGTGALSNGAKYSGVTTDTLTISSVGNGDVADYYCVVTDNTTPARTAQSDNAHLSLATGDPYVTTNPAPATVNAGVTASFTAGFNGSNYSVRWYKTGVGALSNGAKYAGATSNTLDVLNSANADEGDYYCIATDNVFPANTATTGTAALTVQDPIVQTDPVAASVVFHASANFTAAFSGSSYAMQWYKAGTPAPLANDAKYSGVTTATLTIADCVNADADDYYCVATANAPDADTATTTAVPLTVSGDPVMQSDPAPATVNHGAWAAFSVTVDGSNFTVEWFHSTDPTVPLPDNAKYVHSSSGATRTLAVYDCAQADEGGYFCKVTDSTNPALSDQSASAQLTVQDPAITQQPVGGAVNPTESFVLQIEASGTLPLSYQWKKSGSPVADATNKVYTIASALESDQGDYTCTATGADGDVVSDSVHLEVYDPPVITTQPVAQSVDPGGSVTFNIAATGTAPLSYQWRKEGVNIADATLDMYTINLASQSDEAVYTCFVSNEAGTVSGMNVLSDPAQLTVNDPPVILTNPDSATKDHAQAVTFTVTASGVPAPSYQWWKNGASIPDATDASYVISSVANANEGSYWCVASNSAGDATSDNATLTVTDPIITQQPPGHLGLLMNGSGSLTIVAQGSAALSYRWYKNGMALADGGHLSDTGTSTLQLTGADAGDNGSYHCEVTGGDGAVSTATVVQVGDPVISSDPSSLTVNEGDPAHFEITAAGTPTLQYQWQKYNTTLSQWDDVPGEITNAYDIAVVAPSHEGEYRCRVHNGSGTEFSGVAILTVNKAPKFLLQPLSQTVDPTDSVTFSVSLSQGTEPVSYQWRKNGSMLPGATDTSYTIMSVSSADAGNYSCYAENMAGDAFSSAAVLGVNSQPVIVDPTEASTVTRNPGESLLLVATAIGTEPLSYQWFQDGLALPGATSASFSLASVGYANAGDYTCLVSNSAGTKLGANPTSPPITVSIKNPVTILSPLAAQTIMANPGDLVTFLVTFTGTPPFTFEWWKGGTLLTSGAIASLPYQTSLVLPAVDAADEGLYLCRIVNDAGEALAPPFTLQLRQPPSFVAHPQPKSAIYGETVTFSAPATGYLPISYEWLKDGSSIPPDPLRITGAFTPHLTITGATNDDEAAYSCIATNAASIAMSNEAALTVQDPAITGQPGSQSVLPGASASFSVSAVGSALTYQWYKDGAPLADDVKYAGVTTSALTVTDSQDADEGSYHCVVGGGPDADAISDTVTLTVGNPGIMTQPVDQTVNPGAQATFEVVIDPVSTLPVTYRWYKGTTALNDISGKVAGAGGSLLTLSNCQIADEGVYHCKLTGVDTIYSSNATLRVNRPVVIDRLVPNPTSRKVALNAPFTITVFLTDGYTPPIMKYQWKKNGVPIDEMPPFSGTQTPTLTCGSATGFDQADYTVAVENITGAVDSLPVHIMVGDPISFTEQPQGGRAYVGGSISFAVGVSGGIGPIHYQWTKDGANVGADSSTLSIPVVAMNDMGNYRCIVSDDRGPANSNIATLEVAQHLTITQGPQGGTFSGGIPLTLQVSTSGGFGPLSYDWKKNDVVIKHDPTLFFASLDMEDSGSYSVSVSDSFDDTVESAPAEVIVKSTGVPAMNSLGLGIIIALAVLSGALALRRRQ